MAVPLPLLTHHLPSLSRSVSGSPYPSGVPRPSRSPLPQQARQWPSESPHPPAFLPKSPAPPPPAARRGGAVPAAGAERRCWPAAGPGSRPQLLGVCGVLIAINTRTDKPQPQCNYSLCRRWLRMKPNCVP